MLSMRVHLLEYLDTCNTMHIWITLPIDQWVRQHLIGTNVATSTVSFLPLMNLGSCIPTCILSEKSKRTTLFRSIFIFNMVATIAYLPNWEDGFEKSQMLACWTGQYAVRTCTQSSISCLPCALGKRSTRHSLQCMTKRYNWHQKCWCCLWCKCRRHSGAQGNHHTVHDFWLNADTEDLLQTEDWFSCVIPKNLCCAAPQFRNKRLIVLPMPAKLDLELWHGSCRTAMRCQRRSPQKLWRQNSEQPLCHCLLTYVLWSMYVYTSIHWDIKRKIYTRMYVHDVHAVFDT